MNDVLTPLAGIRRTRPDVVIVGAGYAGVHAARTLIERAPGTRVLVVEAADRLGGRARSVEVAKGSSLDLGAHYFGRRQTRIHALARRLAPGEVYAHPPVYGPDPAFRTWLAGSWRETRKSTSYLEVQGLSREIPASAKLAMFASLARYFALEHRIDVEEPWRSPGAYELDRRPARSFIDAQDGPEWIRDMWGLGVLDILSVRPEDISLLHWLWYNRANGGFLLTANDFTGGPQELSVACGLGGLLERYAAETRGAGVDLLLDARVTAIEQRVSSVTVALAGGREIEADCAVVAVTPAVAGRIALTPAPGEARRLLHAQRAGHAAKAIAVYRTAFWRERPETPFMGFSAGARAEGVEWALDTTPPEGPPSLSAFVSDRLLDRAGRCADARRAAVLAGLVELTGDPRAGGPERLEILDWRDHPTTCGGPNTVFAPGVLSRVGDAFGRPEGPHRRVFFAAAEYSTVHPGYVDGAMASGEVAAAQVLWRRAGSAGEAPRFRDVLGPAPRPHLVGPGAMRVSGELLSRGFAGLRRVGL